MKQANKARMPAQRPKDQTASPVPRRQPADATAKARKPKASAPRRRKHSYQRTRKKIRQKERRTPKAYFDARSTTYLTYPEDINKPVNKNC
ncbi:hypothetical protein [Paraburkholderia terrae]|uniref:hypothetical protein n=1 Tax=Paraburkholderia terrae TaxID=311230 RepID=UPI001E3CEAAE|nr:hypothetical protein [Paraburkholderia terrae]